MRFLVCGAALSAALIGGVALATTAKASGLSGLHAHVQIGDRVCMAGHDHYGESGAWATREQAVAAAAWSWGSFTRFEYGEEWAEFRLAHAADMSCGQVQGNDAILWSCKAKAQPCRAAAPVVEVRSRAHEMRRVPVRGSAPHASSTATSKVSVPAARSRRELVWPGDR